MRPLRGCTCADCRASKQSNEVHLATWASDCDAQFACDLSWNAHQNNSADFDAEVIQTDELKVFTKDKSKVTCEECKSKVS